MPLNAILIIVLPQREWPSVFCADVAAPHRRTPPAAAAVADGRSPLPTLFDSVVQDVITKVFECMWGVRHHPDPPEIIQNSERRQLNHDVNDMRPISQSQKVCNCKDNLCNYKNF